MTMRNWPKLRPSRVLLDLREGGGSRGFHLCAAISRLGERQQKAEFWALSGANQDVDMALTLLRQESEQLIPRWQPAVRGVRFSLYVSMADVMPRDSVSMAARQAAARTLLGLMFPTGPLPPERRLKVMDGHDTSAFARRILQEMRPARRLLALGGWGR
jgi:hypothetical protein